VLLLKPVGEDRREDPSGRGRGAAVVFLIDEDDSVVGEESPAHPRPLAAPDQDVRVILDLDLVALGPKRAPVHGLDATQRTKHGRAAWSRRTALPLSAEAGSCSAWFACLPCLAGGGSFSQRMHGPRSTPRRRSRGRAMAVRVAFCSFCNREVHLADADPSSCPVCSSPVFEMPSDAADVPMTSESASPVGPEVYSG
jgi:hypothetical protein